MKLRVSHSKASRFFRLFVLVILLAAVWILQPLALFGMPPFESRLLPSDLSLDDQFGEQVSIDGDTLVTTARLDDGTFQNSGSAYVFRLVGNTWTEEAKLTASDSSAEDMFGRSISLSGDTAVVGAVLGDGAQTDSGAAYVFRRSGTTWTQEAKLIASDGAALDLFGRWVDIDGDTAVVGAYVADASGAVYVFQRTGTTWTQEAKLTANDGQPTDYFGANLAINNDTIVVGAERATGPR